MFDINAYGGPAVTILSRNVRTARKEHLCGYCSMTIEPGHRYERTVALVDGKFTVECRHLFACDPSVEDEEEEE